MTLKLVRLDDLISDVDSVDLTSGGYALALNGYQPAVAADGDYSVTEAITINIQSTSVDGLATLVQALDKKIRQVGLWLNDQGVEKYQVWLRVGLNGETNTRQAQILSIQPPDKLPLFNRLPENNSLIANYTFAIERTALWEEITSHDVSKSSINAIGGTSSQSATAGDAPARLVRFRIGGRSGGANITTAWVGFKTSRFGTAANFAPVWGLNNDFYDMDTTAVSDSTAYTGYRVVTTFATFPALSWRTRASASSASPSNVADQRGTYLVLLRAKMSDAGSIARARINYSFSSVQEGIMPLPVYRSRQVISGTTWHLYEMGVVKNPPARTYQYITSSDFFIHVDAERISGAGALHTDCLILIPIDDGAVKISSPLSMGAGAGVKAAAYQAADNSVWGLVESGGTDVYYSAVAVPQNGWSLPNDTTPLIVCAADDDYAGSVKNSTLDFNYTYITRWRTLRGNTA